MISKDNSKVEGCDVCLLVRTYPPLQCGIGDYALHLSEYLSKKVRLTVLTNVKATSFEGDYTLIPVLNRYILNPIRINSVVSRFQPKILHIQTPILSWNSLIFSVLQRYWRKKYPKMKILITIHEYTDLPTYQKRALDQNIKYSDSLIVVDPIYINEIKLASPLYPTSKIVYIQNSRTIMSDIDMDTVSDIHKQYSEDGRYTLMGFFGFINKLKGIEYILRALFEMKAQGKLNTKFIIIGGLGTGANKYQQELLNLISEYELSELVMFTGYLDESEVNNYIMAMDFMNLPFVDGCSPKNSSMIGALSMNKPIITTKRFGDTVYNSPGIYYLDVASDVETMKQYIMDFQLNSKLLTDVEYSDINLSWDRNGEEHLNVYFSLNQTINQSK